MKTYKNEFEKYGIFSVIKEFRLTDTREDNYFQDLSFVYAYGKDENQKLPEEIEITKYCKELVGVTILYADYTYGDYSGDAFILFHKKDDQGNLKLYEVNGSHCSCYGLENQWQPEETTVKALRMRAENGWGILNKENEDLMYILELLDMGNNFPTKTEDQQDSTTPILKNAEFVFVDVNKNSTKIKQKFTN